MAQVCVSLLFLGMVMEYSIVIWQGREAKCDSIMARIRTKLQVDRAACDGSSVGTQLPEKPLWCIDL